MPEEPLIEPRGEADPGEHQRRARPRRARSAPRAHAARMSIGLVREEQGGDHQQQVRRDQVGEPRADDRGRDPRAHHPPRRTHVELAGASVRVRPRRAPWGRSPEAAWRGPRSERSRAGPGSPGSSRSRRPPRTGPTTSRRRTRSGCRRPPRRGHRRCSAARCEHVPLAPVRRALDRALHREPAHLLHLVVPVVGVPARVPHQEEVDGLADPHVVPDVEVLRVAQVQPRSRPSAPSPPAPRARRPPRRPRPPRSRPWPVPRRVRPGGCVAMRGPPRGPPRRGGTPPPAETSFCTGPFPGVFAGAFFFERGCCFDAP